MSGITVNKDGYLIVRYNETKCPGQVIDLEGEKVKVTYMKSAG